MVGWVIPVLLSALAGAIQWSDQRLLYTLWVLFTYLLNEMRISHKSLSSFLCLNMKKSNSVRFCGVLGPLSLRTNVDANTKMCFIFSIKFL